MMKYFLLTLTLALTLVSCSDSDKSNEFYYVPDPEELENGDLKFIKINGDQVFQDTTYCSSFIEYVIDDTIYSTSIFIKID